MNFDGEHYFLAGTLADDGGGALRFGASCLRGGPKKLTLDGEEVARLADLIGLDTVLFIGEVLHREFGDDKYRPPAILRNYVAAGWLGRKSQRGFYTYDERGNRT